MSTLAVVPILDSCGVVADERQPPAVDRLCLLGGPQLAKRGAPTRLAEESSARDLIAWAQGRTPEQELKRLRRCAPQASLEEIFDMSRQRGARASSTPWTTFRPRKLRRSRTPALRATRRRQGSTCMT